MASALTSRCERGLPVSPARPRATFCRKMCLPTEAEIWANVAMARNSRSPSFRPHAQSCGSVDQFGFGHGVRGATASMRSQMGLIVCCATVAACSL